MSRQLENAARTMNELRDRYGLDDPIVSEWRIALECRAALESGWLAKAGASIDGLSRRHGRSPAVSRAHKLVRTERRGRDSANPASPV